MPNYVYRCPNCDQVTTVTAALADYDPALPCSKCQTPQRRIYDSPGVTFKSPGFYTTDKGQK